MDVPSSQVYGVLHTQWYVVSMDEVTNKQKQQKQRRDVSKKEQTKIEVRRYRELCTEPREKSDCVALCATSAASVCCIGQEVPA